MTPVVSSAFAAVHHQGTSLTVQFHSGAKHRYDPVSKAEFDEMMGSASIGRHFATRIKPVKRSVKVN